MYNLSRAIKVRRWACISRSAGVAKFISVFFNLQFPESYMLYNKHVFSSLIRRWNQRNYPE